MDTTIPTQLGPGIRRAQVVLPCKDLAATLAFFTDQLGFMLERIFPADAPSVAVISGHGVTLRLDSATGHEPGAPLVLHLLCDHQALPPSTAPELVAPGGTRIVLVDHEAPVAIPPGTQEFIVTRMTDSDDWTGGRAGMLYRDLVPGRLGGRFIASHVRIAANGPVPDYVHYHKIRFQMIFGRTGWARLVYEDQGEPFLLEAGDCVLQPPEIRHRVLEASPGCEVIEIGCPAAHETVADHVLALPTRRLVPDRMFGGQRFVRHVAAGASWQDWRARGFEARDTGIADATAGLASACVVRPRAVSDSESDRAGAVDFAPHGGELLFLFVLAGTLGVDVHGFAPRELGANDSCVIPGDASHALRAGRDLEMLEVKLPARLPGA